MNKREARQEANRQIVKTISAAVECYPDMRFFQILYMFSVIDGEARVTLEEHGFTAIQDDFNMESVDILKRMRDNDKMVKCEWCDGTGVVGAPHTFINNEGSTCPECDGLGSKREDI